MTEEKVYPPLHPGELLRDEFLEPMGITAYELAKAIGVPAPRVYDIVREKRGISADTALRLSRFFGMSEEYWINAQAHYELEVAKDRAGDSIAKEVQPLA
jgi:addiction module HigA family antidote